VDDALGPGTIVAKTQGKQQVARPPQVRVAASDAVATLPPSPSLTLTFGRYSTPVASRSPVLQFERDRLDTWPWDRKAAPHG
jgi:hypothetical protein